MAIFFFFVILNYIMLIYFRLCETIVGYFWLLKVINPYVIIGYLKLYYHRLFMVILLMAIGHFYRNGY
jgi:hypothetical protein